MENKEILETPEILDIEYEIPNIDDNEEIPDIKYIDENKAEYRFIV